MSSAPKTLAAPSATSRPSSRRRGGLRSATRHQRSRTVFQPLHEALALGLGCTATGYRLSALPEWR
ncbi:hypothetical protein BH23ACT10_BH23ACT10_21380 [soil metagenome]